MTDKIKENENTSKATKAKNAKAEPKVTKPKTTVRQRKTSTTKAKSSTSTKAVKVEDTKVNFSPLNDKVKERLYGMLDVSSTMTDYANAVRTIVRAERNFAGLHNFSLFEKFIPDEDVIPVIYKELIEDGYILIGSSDYFSIFVDEKMKLEGEAPRCYINFDQNRHEFLFFGQGDKEALEKAMAIFKRHLSIKVEKADSIKEFYFEGGGMGTRDLNIDFTKTNAGYDCFYPWLKEAGLSLEEFVEDYLNSNESILILHGPAGTGKSTLINEILKRTKGHIGITSDNVLMMKGYNSLISTLKDNNYAMMILEDADILIGHDREGGNVAISPFLNIADGIGKETSGEKKVVKIIFTTNIVDEKKIDDALLRPGRCYGIVTFSRLNEIEAREVAKQVNPTWTPEPDRRDYSLAEVANQRTSRIGNDKEIIKKFGAGFHAKYR